MSSQNPDGVYLSQAELHNILLLENHLLALQKDSLLFEEKCAVKSLISDLKADQAVSLAWPDDFFKAMKVFLDTGLTPQEYLEIKAEAYAEARERPNTNEIDRSIPAFSRTGPAWHLMLSQEFIDAIAKIDKKLQGRVLEAITRIAVSPIEPVGDTVKPLTGDLKGFWRYRIGIID